jgi:hypothetical protein
MKVTKALPLVLDYATPRTHRPVTLNDGFVTTGMCLAWLGVGLLVLGVMLFVR